MRILRSFVDSLGEFRGFGSLFAWAVVIGLAVGVIVLLRRLGSGLVPDRAAAHRQAAAAIDWQNVADEAMRRGDLREATRALFRALVATLAVRGVVPGDPSTTAGECRAAVARQPALGVPVGGGGHDGLRARGLRRGGAGSGGGRAHAGGHPGGRRVSGRTRAILAIAALAVLMLAGLLLAGPPVDDTLALRRFLTESGLDVSRSTTPPGPPGTFVLLEDLRNDAEAGDLLRWVEAGGRLVVADPSSRILNLLDVGVGRTLGLVGTKTLAASCAVPEVIGANELAADAGDATLQPSDPGALACFARPGGSYLVVVPRGERSRRDPRGNLGAGERPARPRRQRGPRPSAVRG